MSQVVKDWIEQDREAICDQYANGEIDRDNAIRELERLGLGTQEAREMLD